MAVSPSSAPPVRLSMLAIAAWTAVLGAGIAIAIAPYAWAVDANRDLQAAAALAAGSFGEDHGYLYSPLAAALAIPATWLPAGVAISGWLLAKVAILVGGALHEAPIALRSDRVIVISAAVAAVMFLPALHDILLGNVSIVVALAVAIVVWRPDGLMAGVLLGILVATAPKPQLIPILAWMVVFRPRALIGAALVALVATAVALILVGPDPYRAWIGILRAPEYLDGRPTSGNISLLTWPPAVALPLALAAAATTVVAMFRGPWPGLVACMALGLLVAPYTMAYSAVVLLVVAKPLAIVSPRATLALAFLAPILILLAFPIWVGAVIAVAVATPVEGWSRAPFRPGRWPIGLRAGSAV